MNRKELVKTLTPKLLGKVSLSIKFLRKYGIQEPYDRYRTLTEGAIWVAAGEVEEEQVFKRAKSILTKWILEDIQPILAENLRHKDKHLTDDFFTLPWGQKVNEVAIKSGELAVAIDPNSATDRSTLLQDNVKRLTMVLDDVMEHWGPQALVWFTLALLYDNQYISIAQMMGVKNVHKHLTQLKKVQRTIRFLKKYVKAKYAENLS